eukprot:g6382.t1
MGDTASSSHKKKKRKLIKWRRRATHAGSWYEDDEKTLRGRIGKWTEKARKDFGDEFKGKDVRALIGPHAGYSYCGETAGFAYFAMNPERIERVFVLGPSHRIYTSMCHVSSASSYESPLGDVEVDTDLTRKFLSMSEFTPIPEDAEEDEHSIEMHVPFIAATMSGHSYKIVPIMVGSLSEEKHKQYGKILAPYLKDPRNFFVVSSDFCHWGRRFSFQWTNEKLGPIHKSIEWLDRKGMEHIEKGSSKDFSLYLKKYENTICGRHPICLLLNALEQHSEEVYKIKFTRYSQSDQCVRINDSSVSYASAVVTCVDD